MIEEEESKDTMKRFNDALLSSGSHAKEYVDALRCFAIKKVT